MTSQQLTSSRTHGPNLWKDGLMVSLLAAVSLAVGLGMNTLRDKPFSLVYKPKKERVLEAAVKFSSEESLPGKIREVGLEEFQALMRRGSVILDARAEVFHRLGHIPGAKSFPREDFESAYELLGDDLAGHRAETVLVYCSSGNCEDSHLVAEGLARLGFHDVAILAGGWSVWQRHGQATEEAP